MAAARGSGSFMFWWETPGEERSLEAGEMIAF
jgi:hypothetical protein